MFRDFLSVQLISGKVFQLICRNLLSLGLESPHHYWPTFGFCPSGTKRCVANWATFWTPCYIFSWRSQAKETLSFLKANNNIPYRYLISEKLKILLFIQLSTQWHQMPSKTLERRRATPSMHRLGWIWSGFVFRSTGRIGLIDTYRYVYNVWYPCFPLPTLSERKRRELRIPPLWRRGVEVYPEAGPVMSTGWVSSNSRCQQTENAIECKVDNVAELMSPSWWQTKGVYNLIDIDIIFDIGNRHPASARCEIFFCM